MLRFDKTFLRSKFGIRLFTLFVACALLPLFVLLVISYHSVSAELEEQAERRLQELGKSTVMGIIARLNLLDVELQLAEHSLLSGSTGNEFKVNPERFRSIVLKSAASPGRTLAGSPFVPPDLTSSQHDHLDANQPLFHAQEQADGTYRFLLGRNCPSLENSPPSILWGEIENSYLWWGPPRDNTLPAEADLVILLEDLPNPVLSTTELTPEILRTLSEKVSEQSMGSLLWQDAEKVDFRAQYRSANLRPLYGSAAMTIVIGEASNLSMQPFFDFKRNLIGTILLSLWIILLLTIGQIRRHLVPLQELQRGTKEIAEGQLETRVEVQTDDEFADVAASFNSMAGNLEIQFKTLRTSNEFVEAVLSSLNTNRIIDTVLVEFQQLLDSARVVVTLTEREGQSVGHQFYRDSGDTMTTGPLVRKISDSDLEQLHHSRHHVLVPPGAVPPSYYLSDQKTTILPILAFPIFLHGDLVSVIAGSLHASSRLEDSDLALHRHVANQVAVALSNAELVEDLDAMSWGTLTALGRTIDVRSHWTMGHSERVMDLAQRVGKAMGLSDARLDSLLRASLLHDIGKIGVPTDILDKKGSLSPEEMSRVREHVRIGVQILRPVPALRDVVPLVAQHHEWYDGTGYPAGLAGDEICLEAQILAAVDCYDALRSNRPYRAALSHDAVIRYMTKHVGTQFEPQVVDSLLTLLSEDRNRPIIEDRQASIAI